MENITQQTSIPGIAEGESGIRTTQWSSGGESRISPEDRLAIDEAVDDCKVGEYRQLFPLHGAFGAMNLGIDGYTMWLYTSGGAFVAGELVHPDTARSKALPASGTVDLSSLPAEQQQAVMTLLNAAAKRKK